MQHILFKARVGSHAYGTNIEGSDEDFKGVYIQTPEDLLENGYREQINVSKDETYYELRRFVELCCTGNPTMIELLFSPEDCIISQHPLFNILTEHRHKFLSKSCRWSFGGYAIDQIKKARGLEKKMNWEEERKVRKTPLDFCYVITPLGSTLVKEWLSRQKNWCQTKQDYYGVSCIDHCRDLYFIYPSDGTLGYHGIINQDETSNELRLSSIPEDQVGKSVVMSYNKDGYIKHCKDYREYTEWLKNRNTQRYVDVENHGQKIDGKNLLHCWRLLNMGIEIAEKKEVIVRRPDAEFLKAIRQGKYELNKIIISAESLIESLEKAYINSDLPDKVDRGFFMKLVNKIRKEHYAK
jgi:uncharacterized protein